MGPAHAPGEQTPFGLQTWPAGQGAFGPHCTTPPHWPLTQTAPFAQNAPSSTRPSQSSSTPLQLSGAGMQPNAVHVAVAASQNSFGGQSASVMQPITTPQLPFTHDPPFGQSTAPGVALSTTPSQSSSTPLQISGVPPQTGTHMPLASQTMFGGQPAPLGPHCTMPRIDH